MSLKRAIQNSKLKDKLVIICGGSKGIGKETSKLFAKMGANICIIARGMEDLEATKNECLKIKKFDNQKIDVISCDCTDFDKLKPLLDNYIKDNGTPEYLLNMVGYAFPQYVEKLTVEDCKKNLDVNYNGQLVPTLIVLPYLMKAKKGQIAFVSSIVGVIGMMGYVAYAGSKFALVGLAESLRNELIPYNIKISVLYPADTDTPGLAEENKLKPEECAIISESAKLLDPKTVATYFVKGILKKKFSIMKGDVVLFSFLKRFFPKLGFWILDLLYKNARKKLGKT